MRNMKRWKRLLAVGMCSAMMFSMSVGVFATENQDTEESIVEDGAESALLGAFGAGISEEKAGFEENDKESENDENVQNESAEKKAEPKAEGEDDVLPTVKPMTIEYVPSERVEVPVTNGTGKYEIHHVEVEGECVERVFASYGYDSEKGVIHFLMSNDTNVPKKGDYPVTIHFYKEGDELFHTSTDVTIHVKTDSKPVVLKDTSYTTDCSKDLVYRFENGTGVFELEEINVVGFNIIDAGADAYGVELPYFTGRSGFIYDIEKGTVTIKGDGLQSYNNRGGRKIPQNQLGLWIRGKTTQGRTINVYDGYRWTFKYEESEKAEGMPKLVSQSYTFDGTQDLVFKFENGSGDYAVKDVIRMSFWTNDLDVDNRLDTFWLSKELSGGEYVFSDDILVTDIEKGQVTCMDYAVSAVVYDSKYTIANPYHAAMFCEFANGERGYIYSNEQGAWEVEVLPMSPNAVLRHIETLEEGNQISKERMQELVEISKEKDIVIRTTIGLSYVFKKNDFKMTENKDVYDFGVILNTDFSKSGINHLKITAEDYAEDIEYKFDGQLPGKAEINIPVDSKWNGKKLYYFERNSDGTLEDTGESAIVANGVCKVSQSHCSNYVLLAKSPKELGVTENTGNNNNNTGNNNNQSGNGNTQGSSNNLNPQIKPVDRTKTSPKTGDNNMILLFAVLCACSCIAGGFTLKARRRDR